jgi:hypothetical protein
VIEVKPYSGGTNRRTMGRAGRAAGRNQAGNSLGDLLTQHLDELEQEAERKGGVLQTLSDHFARVYRRSSTSLQAA